ncbi:unnamed protein product, partial [Lymnaea stagnalis]
MAEPSDKEVKDLYRDAFETLRARCYRASKMEYEQASRYDGIMEVVELFTYGSIPYGYFKASRLKSLYKGGPYAIPGFLLFGAEFYNLYSTPVKDYAPIIYRRSMMHNIAAAKWEGLQYRTESHLIMMNKKSTSLEQTKEMYEELVKQREAISAEVIVRSKVYEHFNNGKLFENKIKVKNEVDATILQNL